MEQAIGVGQVHEQDSHWRLSYCNSKAGEWGIPYKYETDELARVDMTVSKLPAPIENFTIGYDKSASRCTLRVDWETTRASVDLTAK